MLVFDTVETAERTGGAVLPQLREDGAPPSRDAQARRRAIPRPSPLTALWLVVVLILVLPIALFLAVAFSPALLGQGTAWFSLDAFRQALSGPLLQAFADSVALGVVASVVGVSVGFALAWAVHRTTVPLRQIWTGVAFAILLMPSYLIALGWERLLEPNGVLAILGLDAPWARDVFYGPAGIALILTVKGVPFAYLTISNALRGLGDEYVEASRVHGGSRLAAGRIVVALIAPAVWSALAIVFAESISDYGVAATLTSLAHFPVATGAIYTAVQAFPAQFPVAAAVSWILLGLIVLALVLQNAALRGRSYQTLGGRSRRPVRRRLGIPATVAWVAGLTLFAAVALGVPAFGAVSASMIDGLGSLTGTHRWDFANYQRVLTSPDLSGPLLFSAGCAVAVATVATVMAALCARVLARKGTALSGRLLDFVLLAAVALPGIVFAAGYIFAYNLPAVNAAGVRLYGTTALLLLAYLASALPSTTRVLVGSVGQLQDSVVHASRVHGRGPLRSWLGVGLPVLARPLLSAWLLTYAATLLELPVSQLLSPAGSQPIAVGIENALGKYDFGGGTAMQVIAIASALVVVALGFGLFRLLAPAGWRAIGEAR